MNGASQPTDVWAHTIGVCRSGAAQNRRWHASASAVGEGLQGTEALRAYYRIPCITTGILKQCSSGASSRLGRWELVKQVRELVGSTIPIAPGFAARAGQKVPDRIDGSLAVAAAVKCFSRQRCL